MGELIQVQKDDIDDNKYMTVLGEELETLETSFEKSLASIDQLIQFYSLNPEDEGVKDQYIEIIRSLSNNPSEISMLSTKIARLEKDYQQLYRERLKELNNLNMSSFKKVSNNLETLYEQSLTNSEIQSLEKSLDGIKPIELESKEVLSLDLSKDQLLEMLKIEKDNRARLSFLNEKVYEPDIKKLESDYDRWNEREKDLKRFLTDDLEKINKQIQNVKKTESLKL